MVRGVFQKRHFYFCFVLLLILVFPACKKESLSPMNPHVTGKADPFFEGWYYRITDPESGARIAVICASYLLRGQQYEPGMNMPGYLAVLISREGRTKSIEMFPQLTSLLKDGKPVNEYYAFNHPADFEWRSEYGSITQNSIDIDVPGSCTLHANINGRIPWDDTSEMGPEGPMLFLPVIKAHWFVYSLGSEVSYELAVMEDGLPELLEGSGYIHQEKNWGDTFPTAWIWLQGVNEDNTAHIALSGGKVPLGKDYMTSWLAGYRSKTLNWNYIGGEELPVAAIPAGTIIHTEIDACAGTFYFSAVNPSQKFIVDASAPVDSFFPVSIPTLNGFEENGGIESFDATIIVSAYKNQGHPVLLEKTVFTGAALEFGAGYKCQ